MIGLIDKDQASPIAGLALGFVAGFSEQFVLRTVAKVAGSEDDAKSSKGRKE